MKENYLVCDDCKSLDEKLLKKCDRCNNRFCPHNSSDVSIYHCYSCFQDISLTITNICREVRRINPSTGKEVIIPIKMGIKYELGGSDWLYAAQKVRDFANDPDGDLKFTKMLETHKALYDLMLSYREDTRLAKLDKARLDKSTAIKLPRVSNGSADKVLSSTIHSPEATAKKRVIAVLKLTLGRDPNDAEIAKGMSAFGLTI